MQDYIESSRSLPEARIQDLFQRKNMHAITVRISSEPEICGVKHCFLGCDESSGQTL
jgi:hypothetical protein